MLYSSLITCQVCLTYISACRQIVWVCMYCTMPGILGAWTSCPGTDIWFLHLQIEGLEQNDFLCRCLEWDVWATDISQHSWELSIVTEVMHCLQSVLCSYEKWNLLVRFPQNIINKVYDDKRVAGWLLPAEVWKVPVSRKPKFSMTSTVAGHGFCHIWLWKKVLLCVVNVRGVFVTGYLS